MFRGCIKLDRTSEEQEWTDRGGTDCRVRIDRFYRDNREKLLRYAKKFAGQDAEDCVQETFLRLLYSGIDVDDTYLERLIYKILTNCTKDHVRNEKRRGMVTQTADDRVEDVIDCDGSPEEILISEEMYERIIARVVHKKKMFMYLYFVDGISYNALSKLFPNIPHAYMRKAISDFRKEARKIIHEDSNI